MLQRTGTRFLIVGLLVVLMALPLFMIGAIVDGRLSYSRDVQENVGLEWGGPQIVTGPRLVIPVSGPVTRMVTESVTDATTGAVTQVNREKTEIGAQEPLVLLPERLNATVGTTTEERRRGIFEAPVYTAQVDLDFDFTMPNVTPIIDSGATIEWDKAKVMLGLESNRGLRGETSLTRGGKTLAIDPASSDGAGIQAFVGDPRQGDQGFKLSMSVNGAQSLQLSPVGRLTHAVMKGNWPHPSFTGAFLPDSYTVADSGFDAEWTIPHLARPLPQATRGSMAFAEREQAFGVSFFQPNDFYQKAYRATRYSFLLIALTFLTVLLIERGVTGRPAHPVQYILIGMAQSVFVLLMVAYAEHIGFGPAYLGASVATIALLTLFGWIGLKLGRRVWVLAALLIVLYAMLYLILQSADFALLAGATVAFLAIAATMIATRNEDWWGQPSPPRPSRRARQEEAAPAAGDEDAAK
ncbi:cell envelope integrity protein CreD [Paracoccus pacificus]|uniref:Cell envelope integrity protein CreD n=1 Tax=Paracoccus pacificus TaxID=1463598 RepID=A0ABW4R708_9RHOB